MIFRLPDHDWLSVQKAGKHARDRCHMPFSPTFPETPGSDVQIDSVELTPFRSPPRRSPRCRVFDTRDSPPSTNKESGHSFEDIGQLLWSDSEPLIPTRAAGTGPLKAATSANRKRVSPRVNRNSSPNKLVARRRRVSPRYSPPDMLRRNSSIDSTGLGSSPLRVLNLCSPTTTQRGSKRKTLGAEAVKVPKTPKKRKLCALRPPHLQLADPFSPTSPEGPTCKRTLFSPRPRAN